MASSSKPVLVGADFSDPAVEAIRLGHEWARRRNAALVLCHAMPRQLASGMLFAQRINDAIGQSVFEARVAERLQKLATDVTGRAPEEVEVIVDNGPADTVLARVAIERDAGLLVIGSHRQSGLGSIFLGDAAEALVRDAPCAVLVARPHAVTGRILVAMDLPKPARAALQLAAEEARLRGARITLVTSIERDRQLALYMAQLGGTVQFLEEEYAEARARAEAQLTAELTQVGVAADIVVTDESPAGDLVRAAVQLDADLVVVGAKGGNAKVVRHAPCPVLVVR